jgi:putative RNA 2'-phosphotransferase
MKSQNNHDVAELISISKFLSLVLRHQPQRIGIVLDEAGWVDVEQLLVRCAASGRPITVEALSEVVASSDKKRFAFSDDRLRIRANQGHSVDVALGLPMSNPPDVLYHGTAARSVAGILKEGLQRRSRHHVHLSADVAVARTVGARHGSPVVLRVRARELADQGQTFWRSDNGVWLTDEVPASFLEVME